jgi:glutamine cyclotransferase
MPKNNRIAQGWGIAKISGNEVIVSDGSSELKIVNLPEWKHVSKIAIKF